jgi:hypothetical protein
MRRLRTAALPVLAALAAAVLAAGASAFSVILEPLPAAYSGQPYSHQFRVRGGNPPYTFSLDSGKLPPGLSLSGNGRLTGSPTRTGTWQFYVEASYRYGSNAPLYSQRRFTLDVLAGLSIRTPELRAGTRGVPYRAELTASGGGEQSWSLKHGRLPAGLRLTRDGVIRGVPARTGDSVFTLEVSDGPRFVEKLFVITVAEPLRLRVGSVPVAVVGSPFRTAFHVSGGLGPYSWSVRKGTRPLGVALSNGSLTGTPQAPGRHAFTVSATDSLGNTSSARLTIVVHPRLRIPLQALAPAARGRAYSARIVTRGGAAPLSFGIAEGALPPGLTLDARTGTVSGRAQAAGRYSFTVRVTDHVGGTHRRALVVRVR